MPARVAIVIIAFLALTGLINATLATLPKLSGGTVWLLVRRCMRRTRRACTTSYDEWQMRILFMLC